VLQLKFRVAIPAGVKQGLTVTAMLLHEKFIGFDQKVSMTLPAVGNWRHGQSAAARSSSRQQLAASTDPAADSMTMAGEDPELEGDWCAGTCSEEQDKQSLQQQRDSNNRQEVMGAAAEAYAALQHKQQLRGKRAREKVAVPAAGGGGAPTHSSSNGSQPHARPTGPGVDHVAASSLGAMPPPPKRSRNVVLQGMQCNPCLPHQQEHEQLAAQHNQHTALPQAQQGSAMGVQAGPGVVEPLERAPGSAPAGTSTNSWATAPLQPSIAARYKFMFSHVGATGLPSRLGTSPAGRTGPQGTGASCSLPAGGVSSSCQDHRCAPHASMLGAAMDAGELEVTPAGPGKPPGLAPAGSTQLQKPPGVAAAGLQSVLLKEPAPGLHGASTAGCTGDPQGGWNTAQQQASPVRDVGNAMSSLFDMLAEDEDELEQQQWQSTQQQQVPPLQERLLGMDASTAGPTGSSWRKQQQQQLTTEVEQRRPLAALNHSARGLYEANAADKASAAASGGGPSKVSASAVFGAAVQQSHDATTSLIAGMHRSSSSSQSMQPVPSSHSVRLPGQTAGAAAAANASQAAAGRSGRPQQLDHEGCNSFHVQGESARSLYHQGSLQQLVTPPRQIVRSMFADAACGLSRPGSQKSRGAVSRAQQGDRQQQAAANWSVDSSRAGNTTQATMGLPEFRRFAFTAAGERLNTC